MLRRIQRELCEELATPPGWELHQSQRTGMQYYVHVESGRSQYTFPDDEYMTL